MDVKDLAKIIDHTLLRPDAVASQIDRLCDEAVEYDFHSACVNPSWVERCASRLSGSDVKVCTVVGFPLGATSTAAKTTETKIAAEQGADELDMVMNIGRLLDSDLRYVEDDIREVVETADGRVVKVIIEICYLDESDIVRACKIAEKAGANFVKTSTSFGPSGATASAVKLMRDTVGGRLGVKAAGGIRDYVTAMNMIKAGANRIGASASVQIVESGRRPNFG